jgi:hypothetical protein
MARSSVAPGEVAATHSSHRKHPAVTLHADAQGTTARSAHGRQHNVLSREVEPTRHGIRRVSLRYDEGDALGPPPPGGLNEESPFTQSHLTTIFLLIFSP